LGVICCDNVERCPVINLNLVLSKESTPAKDVDTTANRQRSQFNDEQSNEMARCHTSPLVFVFHDNVGRFPVINLNRILSKASTPAKDVGTTVNMTMIPV
jgi:hypothetical protein